jgi:hypothetical protein
MGSEEEGDLARVWSWEGEGEIERERFVSFPDKEIGRADG